MTVSVDEYVLPERGVTIEAGVGGRVLCGVSNGVLWAVANAVVNGVECGVE